MEWNGPLLITADFVPTLVGSDTVDRRNPANHLLYMTPCKQYNPASTGLPDFLHQQYFCPLSSPFRLPTRFCFLEGWRPEDQANIGRDVMCYPRVQQRMSWLENPSMNANHGPPKPTVLEDKSPTFLTGHQLKGLFDLEGDHLNHGFTSQPRMLARHHEDDITFLLCGISINYIPRSSKCVKNVPFHRKKKTKRQTCYTSWWFQPSWTMCSSKWESSPRIGVKKNELPPPSLLNINMSNGKWHMGWPFKGWYPPSFFPEDPGIKLWFATRCSHPGWVQSPWKLEGVWNAERVIETSSLDD